MKKEAQLSETKNDATPPARPATSPGAFAVMELDDEALRQVSGGRFNLICVNGSNCK